MDLDQAETTIRLLRVVIALLLRQMHEQQVPLKEQVRVLDDLGIKPSEISKILGRSITYVSKELVGIRRNRRK